MTDFDIKSANKICPKTTLVHFLLEIPAKAGISASNAVTTISIKLNAQLLYVSSCSQKLLP